MKKLYYLIVIVLISSLVLTGCLLSNVGQVPANEQSGVSGIFKNLTAITPICIGFEETEFIPGETVTGGGKVYPFLEISSSNSELNLVIIEDGGTDVSYNSSGGDNGCLDGVKGFGPIGAGAAERPLHTNRIIFEFNPGFTVSTFSIDMYDYGDYIHIFDTVNAGEFEVNLNAYADDGTTLINSDSYLISGGKNNIYDACKSSGMEELSVAGPGISKVEIEFTKNIDVGVGFDKICFTPETNICTTDLIAGQTENVGNVEVKYTLTDDFITVTYSTESSVWLLDEIHFHASGNPPNADWPVNKGGNPIPGHFYEVTEDLGGLNNHSFDIPLADISADCGDAIYFAAHAKVFTLTDFHGEIVSTAGSDTNVSIYYYEPIDLLTPGDADVNGLDATAVTPHSSWSGISTSSAVWIAADDPAMPDGSSTWMLFKRMFGIPVDAINISGTLNIKSDNAERVIINENLLDCVNLDICGNIFGDIPSDTHQWDRLNTHILGDKLNAGTNANALDIWVRNYRNNSPIGLIYDLDYEYQLKYEETAWGFGTDFPEAKNWSMYFGCPVLVPCPF